MKIIAITQRLVRNDAYPEIREALDIRWAQLAQAAGFILLPLPIRAEFAKYAETVSITGIILSGGNDLARFSSDELSAMRGDFEKNVLDYAVQHKMPVLGVCRGMQMIADYFGAELSPVPGHVCQRHEVEFVSSPHYFAQPGIVQVNSYHSYGVTALTPALKECAYSTDGAIEAFTHNELPIIGQMWHPEREDTFSPYDLTTIRTLFEIGE